MEFTITPSQSETDHAFFIEEEYQSARENGILLTDRTKEEARQTFITDLEGYIREQYRNQSRKAYHPLFIQDPFA